MAQGDLILVWLIQVHLCSLCSDTHVQVRSKYQLEEFVDIFLFILFFFDFLEEIKGKTG